MASFIEEFYSQGHYMQVAYQGRAYQLHYRDDHSRERQLAHGDDAREEWGNYRADRKARQQIDHKDDADEMRGIANGRACGVTCERDAVRGALSGGTAGSEQHSEVYVLLAGLSLPWFDWAPVAEILTRHSRVITYDRLGAGLSDLPHGRAQLHDECDVLLQLLDHLHINKAVIVGHSMAGFIVETFARLHPERCERIVLLDASIEEKMTGDPQEEELLNARTSWVFRAGQGAVALAWVRTLVAFSRVIAKPSIGELLLDARAHLAVMSRHSALAGALRENHSYLLWASQAAAVRRSLPTLGPVASVVLATGVRPLPRKGRWAERGRAFARQLAATANDVAVIEIAATHLAMRSNPTATAKALMYLPRTANKT